MNAISGAESPRRFLLIVFATMLPILLMMGLTGAFRAESEGMVVGPICEQAANLVPNPGFEDGFDEAWSTAGGVYCFFSDDGSAYEGSNAARITLAPGGGDPVKCTLFTPINKIPVEALRSYDFSAWVRVDPDAAAYLAISFWRLEGVVYENLGSPVLTPVITDTEGAWVQVTGLIDTPAEAEFVRVDAVRDAVNYDSSVWFDKIYFGLGTCLELVKRDNPHEVAPGEPLAYTIVFTNTGREAATGVVVEETYDDYVLYQTAVPAPLTGTNNIWQIGELAAGASGTITAEVLVEIDSFSRNWLINKASINANEITHPISDILYTQILTDGVCAIDLVAVPQAQTGNPGQTVDYELELRNVGLFEGNAELVATSDLDLDISIDQVTCFLSSGGSASTGIHLNVPATMTIPSTDTTWITATLDCPSNLSDRSRKQVSTRVSYYTQMAPSIMKNYCSLGLWEVEPNNECEEAYGPLCLGTEFYGYPDDVWDFYLVYAPERGLVVDLYSGLENIPPSERMQLLLAGPSCTWVAYDPDPSDGYHLEVPGISGPHYIAIYKAEGYSTDWTYTLRASSY